MPDNIGIFIFFHEFFCTTKSYLVDIFIYFFAGHTHPLINNAQGFLFCIQNYIYTKFTEFAFGFSQRRKCFQFLGGIYRVTYQLTKEYFMVAVKKFFNDREYILCLNPNLAFLHSDCFGANEQRKYQMQFSDRMTIQKAYKKPYAFFDRKNLQET